MELRDILPLIFWPWFLVSCVILVRRRLNRATESPTEPSTDTITPPSVPPSDRARPFPDPATGAAPAVPPTGSGQPGPATPQTPTSTSGPTGTSGAWPGTAGSPMADGPEPTALPAHLAPTPPPASSIFDEPTVAPAGSARRPIAELVAGIQMPCDLAPLVGNERPAGAREVVAFVTRTTDAAQVGQAMGAEMRRLGFTLHPRHATEVVASRDDEALVVSVHDQASDVRRAERPAFPGAGDGAVVVELWLE